MKDATNLVQFVPVTQSVSNRLAKALVFSHVPVDTEAQKSEMPGERTVLGAMIYAWNAASALLRHGAYDAYYFPSTAERSRPESLKALFEAHSDRVRFLSPGAYKTLRATPDVTLMTPGVSMADVAVLRRQIGKPDSVITGVAHSLNYHWVLSSLLTAMLSPLQETDALFCSSSAGRTVIEKLTCLLTERCRNAGFGPVSFRPQLPVIPLGVNTNEFSSGKDAGAGRQLREQLRIPVEADVILYFGRFSPLSKGDLQPLITAFSVIPTSGHSPVLILAGDDTHLHLSATLEDFAKSLGCLDRMRVLPDPGREQKHLLYAIADVFVSPSDSFQETFGLTLVEAMASGLPVVASDWNGYREIVQHGVTGFLVPTSIPTFDVDFSDAAPGMLSEDLFARTTVVNVDSLRAHLETLLANREARAEMGARARRRARALYDWSSVVRSYERVWSELGAQARSGPLPQYHGVDLSSYPQREIFSHYGADELRETDWIELSDIGEQWIRKGTPLGPIAVPSLFQVEDLKAGLETLWNCGPMRVLSVAAGLAAHRGAGSEAIAIAHVARLVKYGLVRVRRPIPS